MTTVFKTDSPPMEFGLTGGYSWIFNHNSWVSSADSDEHTSEGLLWMNIITNVEHGNYNIFQDKGFGEILSKRYEFNGSVYVSLNRYFFSKLKQFRWRSCIWSVGAGFAKTNNYLSLKNRTLNEGALVYNADSTLYKSVVETTSGRSGEFVNYKGFSSYGELFIPFLRNKKRGSIYWGNRLTYYGIGGGKTIINGNTGLYFNIKDGKQDPTDTDKPAKDVVNFSVTTQFNQLNNSRQPDYIDKNFTVLFQATVPLRFN